MQIQVGEGTYFVVSFMDEYSRYLVHFESATAMHGITVSTGAQAAIDTLPKGEDGKPVEKPEIRSDNGSGYISKECKVVLKENGLGHHRIKPHCPEENGLIERMHRNELRMGRGLPRLRRPALGSLRRRNRGPSSS
jgi:transposase InsO family protein